MLELAWYNLCRDKVRFLTAQVGLVFAVDLMAVHASIFIGAVRSSSLLVRQADGDLWIVPQHASNADFSAPIPSRRRYQALGIPGVARAGRRVVGFGFWQFQSGRQEAVIVVGTDTDHNWLPADRHLIRQRTNEGQAVLLDERERERFGGDDGILAVGQQAELNGHRLVVAGFLHDMGSFAITPYVFTSYKAALDFTNLDADRTVFVMIKCEPGVSVERVRAALAERIPDVEVLTRETFATRCWRYWVMGTGMGMSLILMAVLALIVGMMIVGQTFLTAVRIKLREYGLLKALGFGNRFVAGVILTQGVIVAVLGYLAGCVGSLIITHYGGTGGTAVNFYMPSALFAGLLPLTLLMCITASLGAAWRVFRLAPAEVFR